MSYGRIFEMWREVAGNDWHDYTHHAFVEGLHDGTLPKESFLHYLRQDYLFLVHFSRAWALGVTKAGTLEEMRECATMAKSLIDAEMRLHVEICAAAGIDGAVLAATPERVENIAYTRYVMDAGHSGDFIELLAALMPCCMGYGEVGRRLIADAEGAVYRDWIETYGGSDYQNMCADLGRLVDGAVLRRLGPAPEKTPCWERICERFTTATRLEIGFWDMGLTP